MALSVLLVMAQRTRSKEELEKHFQSFVEFHDSPSRKKFALEFAASVVPLEGAPAVAPPKGSFASRLPTQNKHSNARHCETTNQLAFQSYTLVESFKPETKHRTRKAPNHEFTVRQLVSILRPIPAIGSLPSDPFLPAHLEVAGNHVPQEQMFLMWNIHGKKGSGLL